MRRAALALFVALTAVFAVVPLAVIWLGPIARIAPMLCC